MLIKTLKTAFLTIYKKFFFEHPKQAIENNTHWEHVDYYIKAPKRVYTIGDIHGCDKLLEEKLNILVHDAAQHPQAECIFVGLGDYIDRGNDSKRVIELLTTKIPDNFEKIFLKGNHELYMINFMKSPHDFDIWLDYGGKETLMSYNIIPPTDKPSDVKRVAQELQDKLPKEHLEFLNNLKNFHIIDDYFFVHAGIDPDISLENQHEYALTSIRTKFLNHTSGFQGKKIIHGHTPVEKPDIQHHRINLDTGAYLSNQLTLAVIENNVVSILP